MRIMCQKAGRITNEVTGVKGLTLVSWTMIYPLESEFCPLNNRVLLLKFFTYLKQKKIDKLRQK